MHAVIAHHGAWWWWFTSSNNMLLGSVLPNIKTHFLWILSLPCPLLLAVCRDKHVGSDFSSLELSALSRDSVSFCCVWCGRAALSQLWASTLLIWGKQTLFQLQIHTIARFPHLLYYPVKDHTCKVLKYVGIKQEARTQADSITF